MTTATAGRLTLEELSDKERNERFDRLQENARRLGDHTTQRGGRPRSLSTSPSKVIIKRDRHVASAPKWTSRRPKGGVRKLAAVLHLTVVLISIFIDLERPVAPRSETPRSDVVARLDQ